nr:hypothetical protein [Tanacetum cinerariifolium]
MLVEQQDVEEGDADENDEEVNDGDPAEGDVSAAHGEELKFNIFSVSQMCDKKNSVLFTDIECLVLSPDFKLLDESQVLLRVPMENNMYNVNLKNIVPSGYLTCLFSKETIDESNLLHRSLNKKSYCLVVTDDYSRFTWVFFLATKDETSIILKTIITGLENQLSLKVKVIRSDNGTEFKNNDLNQFCGMKRIKREFSVPRTPQQNGIAERKNKTLIEAARTMLADSFLPILFWAEAVNTACYVQNRVLVTKPHNKTPYELLHGRTPSISFMRPFGCPVTILNTLDSLGKFDEKVDEGFLVGYSNTDGDATFDRKEPEFNEKKPESEVNVSPSSRAQSRNQDNKTKREAKGKSHVESFTGYRNLSAEFKDCSDNSINEVNAADASQLPDDPDMPELKDITYSDDKDNVGADVDFNNLETSITVSPISTTRVHKDHHVTQIIGDLSSATQTRSMTRLGKDQGGLSQMFNGDFHTCMFACFLSQEEPKRVHQALKIQVGLKLCRKSFFNSRCRSQDKYIVEILRKFGLIEGKSASTPIYTEKPLLKDPDGEDVDVHTYRSMIGSLMYLTSSRPDIMFVVCACAHFQVTPKASHLHAVKRIFRYLKGKPHLGLCEGFNQIIDFLNGSSIKYALTVNPNIYVSSIKQFWTTVSIKKVNDVIRLQALVDKKKVVITEATIREALCLDDAEGVECRKFNFSKYIFDSLVRNVDSTSKFYMYPCFLQLMIREQVGDLSTHTIKYTSPALTQKVFANMRRVAEEGDAAENDENVNAGDAAEGDVSAAHGKVPTVDARIPMNLLQEVTDTSTALTRRVEHLELDKVTQAIKITKLKQRVKELERRNKVKVLKLRRLQKVRNTQSVETSDETVMDDGRMITDMDVDADIVLEKAKEVVDTVKDVQDNEDETEPAKVQEVVDVVTTAKLITKVVAAGSETIIAASTNITTAKA